MRHLAVGLLALAACGDDGGSHAVDGGHHDAAMVDSPHAPAEAGSCLPGGPFGGGEPSLTNPAVTAKVVDQDGAPVAGQPAYVCGLDVCSVPATTAADGTVSVSFTGSMTGAAFKVGDAIAYGELAVPLTQATTDLTATPIALGHVGAATGAALTPGTSPSSGDVVLDLPAGATVQINTLLYDTADKQELRTSRIALTDGKDDVVLASTGKTGWGVIFAVAPAETAICSPAKVTAHVPSNVTWVAGDHVEFWITTADVAQQFAPYAKWAKVSGGVVNPDGHTVSTNDGEGFDYLSTFAIRKAD